MAALIFYRSLEHLDEALRDATVQTLLEVFPSEIRTIEPYDEI